MCTFNVCVVVIQPSLTLQLHGLPRQAPSVWGFSRQEHWSGLPFPSPGESSQPRTRTWVSSIADRFFTTELSEKPVDNNEKEKVKSLSRVQLCDPRDCSLPGSSIHGIFQARVLEWVAISFSRGIFLIQGSNLGLPHCRQMLYRLSHQGSLSI